MMPGSEAPSPGLLHLHKAKFSDLPAIARIWTSAFFDDEIIGKIMHPNRNEHPDDVYWFLLRGIRERFWNWRHQFLVVCINEKGVDKIVGASDWRRLGKGGESMELWKLDPREFNGHKSFLQHLMKRQGNAISPCIQFHHRISLHYFPNRAADPNQASFLDDAVANSEKYWTGHRSECWDLHVCGVDPAYQGKGVGKLLAQWGVDEARKGGEEQCASVLCGEKNRGFYGKAGFTVQVGGSKGEGSGIALFTR